MDKKTVQNIRLTEDLKKQVDSYASSIGLSASAFFRMAVIEKMKENK